nr:nucleotidyltransferase domain-containing protein [uncultured Blautia sp.]
MTRQEVLMVLAQGTKRILKNNLSKLIVYGSYARGDYKENSDIDVMILTPLSKEGLYKDSINHSYYAVFYAIKAVTYYCVVKKY